MPTHRRRLAFLKGQSRERVKTFVRRVRRASPFVRFKDLERRIDDINRWMASLYPPGEYFVTGVR
jgi:hypothetical protein